MEQVATFLKGGSAPHLEHDPSCRAIWRYYRAYRVCQRCGFSDQRP